MNHFFQMQSSYKKMENESSLSPLVNKISQGMLPVLEDTNQVTEDATCENLSQLQSIFPLHEPKTLMDLLKVHENVKDCVDTLLEKEVQKQIQCDFQLASLMEKQ